MNLQILSTAAME